MFRILEAGEAVAFEYLVEGKLETFDGTIERKPCDTGFLLKDGNSVYAFEQAAVTRWFD